MWIQQTGAGAKTVIGLHGWSGDHRTFDPLLKSMPKDYRFYAPDLPGCGQSDLPKRWEMRSLAREVAEELMQLNCDEVTLVGSCSGAILTAFVARELTQMGKGNLVRRLVMIDPFAFCPWYFRLFLIPGIGPLMYATAFANPLGRWITNLLLQEKRTGDTHLTRAFSHVDHEAVWKYLKVLSQCGSPDQFRGLDLPVEILYGEKTFSAVRESVQAWQAALPRTRVRELRGVGHLPIDEGTRQVAEIVFGGVHG